MAFTEVFANSATISSTEYSLTNNSTTIASQTADGVYQAFLDFSALTITEQYRVKVYEKVRSGDSQKLVTVFTVAGPIAEIFALPSLMLLHGWDITVQKIAGTDRAIVWSIRQVA